MAQHLSRLIAVTGLFIALPAAASQSAAEQSHCRAVGITLGRLAAAENQVVRMLKDGSGADPDRIAQLEAHAAEMAQTAADLKRRYAAAYTPPREELDALDRTPIDDLNAQAQDCLN